MSLLDNNVINGLANLRRRTAAPEPLPTTPQELPALPTNANGDPAGTEYVYFDPQLDDLVSWPESSQLAATPVGGSKGGGAGGAGTTPTPASAANKTGKQTSYQASGLISPPVLETEVGSSRPVTIRELVPELISPFQRVIVYGSMMNDAGVDVSMRAAKTPVLGAEFFMEAFDGDPSNVEIAEFCWANLAEGMSAPFLNSMQNILEMYTDGYSTLEKVYEVRSWSAKGKGKNSKQYTMLKKLGARPSSTIKQIDYDDNGGPVQLVQNAIKADGQPVEVALPISKCIIFTFSQRGGDLTGRSLLRTAYPHWYYKTHFYKIDAIQKERHGIGVPRGKLLAGYNEADKAILRTLLRNLRTNEEAFIMQTPNVEIDFVELSGNPVDVLVSAEHHNMMILMNVMGQFLALGMGGGASGGGGRATGGVQSDLFMKALRYVANYIVDQINMYVIPELVVWNFPTTNFPKLKVRNIGETRDLQMMGSAIAGVLAQGGIIMDDPTENWIRRLFDMPERTTPRPANATNQPQAQAQPAQPTNGNQPAQPAQPAGGNGAPQKGNVKPTANNGGGYKGKPPGAAASSELSDDGEPSIVENMEDVVEIYGHSPSHSDNWTDDKEPDPVADIQRLFSEVINVTVPPPPEQHNTTTHQHDHQFDLHVDEGAISVPAPNIEVSVPAPIVNVHIPAPQGVQSETPTVKQLKPSAAVAKKQEDGSTRIEYEYSDTSADEETSTEQD